MGPAVVGTWHAGSGSHGALSQAQANFVLSLGNSCCFSGVLLVSFHFDVVNPALVSHSGLFSFLSPWFCSCVTAPATGIPTTALSTVPAGPRL